MVAITFNAYRKTSGSSSLEVGTSQLFIIMKINISTMKDSERHYVVAREGIHHPIVHGVAYDEPHGYHIPFSLHPHLVICKTLPMIDCDQHRILWLL